MLQTSSQWINMMHIMRHHRCPGSCTAVADLPRMHGMGPIAPHRSMPTFHARFRKQQGNLRLAATNNDNTPAAATADTTQHTPQPLPRSPLEMVEQAGDAVQRALDAGQRRQKLQLLLPTNEKEYDFLATEALDYPCSLQREFEMAVNLSKAILLHVLGKATPLKVTRIDDAGIEGEPCAVVFTESKDFLMVVFPTAERLKDIRELAKDEQRTVVLVNPQWNDKGVSVMTVLTRTVKHAVTPYAAGQIVSDFGFGPWKKAAMDFLGTFTPSYRLVEQRIGAPGQTHTA